MPTPDEQRHQGKYHRKFYSPSNGPTFSNIAEAQTKDVDNSTVPYCIYCVLRWCLDRKAVMWYIFPNSALLRLG